MTEQEIRDQVARLNELFDITPCGVRFSPNTDYGGDAGYYPVGVIVFNTRHLGRITESVVAHEFAHHLNQERRCLQANLKRARKAVKQYTKALKSWSFGYGRRQIMPCKPARKKTRRVLHGDDFVICLKQIIRRTGMEYSVEREYSTVARKLKEANCAQKC